MGQMRAGEDGKEEEEEMTGRSRFQYGGLGNGGFKWKRKLRHRVPFPHISCRSEAGSVFLEETGLALHFRAKSSQVNFI